ncbi:MAG: epoxyqueuosine reductase QueH [Eubacterium sp.]|nr:epoxyqueuosine reductase QueH [Eubacterium sp.]
MKNVNYYKEFEKQLESIRCAEHKPTLLLHACCAPCSSYCMELLAGYFDITVYFYNPNIDMKEEYEKRYGELVRLVSEADFTKGVNVALGEYEPELFQEMAKGREDLPEKGARCYDCYKLRMKKSAFYAAANGFDYFSTTLSISPYKIAEWINEIGADLAEELKNTFGETAPHFLYSDFKKKNGYKRSIELSAIYGLYRQNYCGCRYSRPS